ncbi:MAG: hypothetical protein ICV66_10315 [Chitinophagaceae bacterium]|nr:hypothetical protein [Chitinophagaceae bacterium]
MITPIETIYKGRRFRSRLEARWAIFFDAIDIGWEYETEGFQIGNTKYLTDFKLLSFGSTKVDLFVEIKSRKPSIEEIKKCYDVSVGTNTDLLLICGMPGLPEFSTLGGDWNLKTGYVALHFPAQVMLKGKDVSTPFELWAESCRFKLFQTGPDGDSLDIWPIYFLINSIDDKTHSYGILSKIDSKISQGYEVFGVNPFGTLIRSHYFSSNSDGRLLDHERLIYGYEVATCARFEHDEFNLTMVDGFYRELEIIPFNNVYSSNDNAYALYYDLKDKKFISKKTNESKPVEAITLVKRAPKLIIKQFVVNYPHSKRTDDEEQVFKIWKGFLFRWRIQLKDLKLKRKTK